MVADEEDRKALIRALKRAYYEKALIIPAAGIAYSYYGYQIAALVCLSVIAFVAIEIKELMVCRILN